MDSSLIVAFAGSAIDGVASIIATQDFLSRRSSLDREIVVRERLYVQFLKEASDLHVHSLGGSLDNLGGLIPVFSVLGRIKIEGENYVKEATERVCASIIESYKRPKASFTELHSF